jgi:hypothetical protein
MADDKKVQTIEGTNLVVIEGVQYRRGWAEAHGLIEPSTEAKATGATPTGTRARGAGSAAKGGARQKAPVTAGAAGGAAEVVDADKAPAGSADGTDGAA